MFRDVTGLIARTALLITGKVDKTAQLSLKATRMLCYMSLYDCHTAKTSQTDCVGHNYIII